MSDAVGDTLDIAATMVLLRAKHANGAMRTPLSVELVPKELQAKAWQLEAERYLHLALSNLQNQAGPREVAKRTTRMSASKWEQLSKEFEFDGSK